MDNSAYITLSRQLALFRDMDVTAGNIANANTTGYNAEHITFNSYLIKDNNSGMRNDMAFAYDISTYRDTSVGSFTTTGNSLDVALQSDGYFTIQTPLGIRYTRAGNFQLDGTGQMITPEGYIVLDNSGQPITFPEDTVSIEIGSGGNIKANGQDFSTLGVVRFDNPQLLERLHSGLYKSDITPPQMENPGVAQGVLENSNVKPIVELTHMMEVSRAVANTAKFVETLYDLQRKTANTWSQQG